MTRPTDLPPEGPQLADLLAAVQAWQQSQAPREVLIGLLTHLDDQQGGMVQELIEQLAGQGRAQAPSRQTDEWRAELMASRARAWASPNSAGLLVGPTVLILSDGRRGVVLSERGTRPLGSSVAASLLLLAQTIVLADHALDSREVSELRQQRIESSSTSLSEIKPVS
ncbi:hypothetical protein [Deinococcus sp. YIM 77859]|uniref:hypothetical protein n=1 Tax=Deinococcus sp. YIM 77859 TaxID=1540221 RepID=UPI00054EEE5A|nr:hypothetical protein [Deinococcus sp. YIM 77859]